MFFSGLLLFRGLWWLVAVVSAVFFLLFFGCFGGSVHIYSYCPNKKRTSQWNLNHRKREVLFRAPGRVPALQSAGSKVCVGTQSLLAGRRMCRGCEKQPLGLEISKSWGVKKCAIAWNFPKGARRILVIFFPSTIQGSCFEEYWETVKSWKAEEVVT